MANKRPIFVNVGADRQYHREVWSGIIHFIQVNRSWILDGEPTSPLPTIRALTKPFPDGVIMMSRAHDDEEEFLIDAGIPFVSLSYGVLDVPRVFVDPVEIGRMAFQHILERGFRNFAFCGLNQNSHFRGRPFEEAVAAGGHYCHRFEVTPRQQDEWNDKTDRKRLTEWLVALPKPIGILAMNDVRGRHVTAACEQAGIAVPDEVAVLGVDNEMPHCELSRPPLSSIATNAFQVGFEAAKMLDQLVAGVEPAARVIKVAPGGIVARQSTDIAAASDPVVGRAVRFIRAQACEGIGVADVLRHVVVSRTWLDTHFRELLGRTPHEEITRVKLERARELLRQTKLSIEVIAERSGFKYAAYLAAVFHKHYHQTPGQYRAQSRALDG